MGSLGVTTSARRPVRRTAASASRQLGAAAKDSLKAGMGEGIGSENGRTGTPRGAIYVRLRSAVKSKRGVAAQPMESLRLQCSLQPHRRENA
jgi:hypothetical protein